MSTIGIWPENLPSPMQVRWRNGDTLIVIVRALPVLQCRQCGGEAELETSPWRGLIAFSPMPTNPRNLK